MTEINESRGVVCGVGVGGDDKENLSVEWGSK